MGLDLQYHILVHAPQSKVGYNSVGGGGVPLPSNDEMLHTIHHYVQYPHIVTGSSLMMMMMMIMIMMMKMVMTMMMVVVVVITIIMVMMMTMITTTTTMGIASLQNRKEKRKRPVPFYTSYDLIVEAPTGAPHANECAACEQMASGLLTNKECKTHVEQGELSAHDLLNCYLRYNLHSFLGK